MKITSKLIKHEKLTDHYKLMVSEITEEEEKEPRYYSRVIDDYGYEVFSSRSYSLSSTLREIDLSVNSKIHLLMDLKKGLKNVNNN